MLLPATPAALLSEVIEPALAKMPVKFDSFEARVLLAAIALQEGGAGGEIRYRAQIGGPARSCWMFEENGIEAVMMNPITGPLAIGACTDAGIPLYTANVYNAFESDDELPCVFARLLLYSDPRAIPGLGDAGASWDYYLRNWRPGKPRPEDWAANYAAALKAVTGQ